MDSESEGYKSNTDGEKYSNNFPTTIFEENEDEKSSTSSDHEDVLVANAITVKDSDVSNTITVKASDASNTSVSTDDEEHNKNSVGIKEIKTKDSLQGVVQEIINTVSVSEKENEDMNLISIS